MRRLLILTQNELRLLLRDRRSFILLFLMPALLVFTLSGILNHLYNNQKPSMKLLIVSSKETVVGTQLKESLRRIHNSVSFSEKIPEDAHREYDLLIKIPSNLPQLLRSDPAQNPERVEFVFYKFLDPFQKSFVMNEFVRLLQAEIIKEVNSEIASQNSSPEMKIADPSLLVVEAKNAGARDFPPLNFSLAAWSLFAIFFIVIPFSNSFYRDWNNEILLKFKSLHLTKTQVLGSRVLAYLGINFLQFLLLLILGLFVFPLVLSSKIVISPSSYAPLFLIVFFASLTASAYALLVSCITKSQEQASSLGAFGVVLMSLIGGIMVPTVFMPPFMVNYIAKASPLYWGLEGFAEAFQSNPDFSILSRSILVLLLFAFSFYLVALTSFRWEKK